MHPLMAAVLLRMARPDQFDPIPRHIHQAAVLLKLNKAWAEAKGTPLSLPMLAGGRVIQ
jgi:hypothetical protein